MPHFLDTNILLYSISAATAEAAKRDRALELLDYDDCALSVLAVFDRALQIMASRQLSYWDSAIVAAAQALGCRILYSEDMGDRREVDSVRITNPFR